MNARSASYRTHLLIAAGIGAVVSLLLTGALVRILESHIDFTEAARATFWPVRFLIWAAIGVYVTVPLLRWLRSRRSV